MGIRTGAIPILGVHGEPYEHYQSKKMITSAPPGFKLVDQSGILGIQPRVYYGVESVTPTYVAVEDFDRDQYMDLLFIHGPYPTSTLTLLRNEKGKRFEDVTTAAGLGNAGGGKLRGVSAVQFVDLNDDGWPDLILTMQHEGDSDHVLFNDRGKFTREVPIRFAMSNGSASTGLNLLDFDQDGLVDVLSNTFFNYKGPASPFKLGAQVKRTLVLNRKGGPHTLLLRGKDQRFYGANREVGLRERGLSWATGIADFDGDGYPDIYFANDYGVDQVYRNVHGTELSVSSDEAIGKVWSRSSMSAVVGDFDGDGKPDLYVSNLIKPGMGTGFNSLWKNVSTPGSLKFQNVAVDAGVDRCGFSWGGQFVDLNMDGRLDLFIVNGRGAAYDWYPGVHGNAPNRILAADIFNLPIHSVRQRYFSHRPCIFVSDGAGHFQDHGSNMTLSGSRQPRGVASVDFDNDGRPDLALANLHGTPTLLHNESTSQQPDRWIGVRLYRNGTNRLAIGAKAWLRTEIANSREPRTHYREVYPGNGFLSQSDPRLIFALLPNERVVELYVQWSPESSDTFRDLKENRYQDVVETHAAKRAGGSAGPAVFTPNL